MKEGGRSNADQRRGNPQLGILIFQTLFKLQTIKSTPVRRENWADAKFMVQCRPGIRFGQPLWGALALEWALLSFPESG